MIPCLAARTPVWLIEAVWGAGGVHSIIQADLPSVGGLIQVLGIMGDTLSQLESAAHFGGFVLAHAALIASDLGGDELICPFAVVMRDDRREVIDFEAETQVEAVERGKASLAELKDKIDSWAFAREGLQSHPDRPGKIDVLLVSCWVSGMSEPLVLIQAFNPAQTGNFRLFGPTEIIQDGQAVPPELLSQLSTAVQQGIGSRHVPWAHWLAHDA